MSLRYQISIIIFFFSLAIMLSGGVMAIWQARHAVADELASSINLALQLIELDMPTAQARIASETEWVQRLAALEQTRHLTIQLKQPSGEIIEITGHRQLMRDKPMPPAWFIKLVAIDYPPVEHPIISDEGDNLILLLQANPLDEITEVWRETSNFFALLLALIISTFLTIHLVFGRTIRAIDIIVSTLQRIETGEYNHKLPPFYTREYASIANAINHMTDVLEATRQQNRALTQHSLTIQEEERQRLAQELHDEFAQSLTAIKVMAISAAHERTDTAKVTASIVSVCDHLTGVVRSMMQQLHPLILTELGLKASLQELVQNWAVRNPELTLRLECEEAVNYLDKSMTIQIFRVVQECLTNIVRHAQAKHVNILLAFSKEPNQALLLLIRDDGKGCEIDQVSSGFGLLSMQERVKSLDGKLHLQSHPGDGMTIKAVIPLSGIMT